MIARARIVLAGAAAAAAMGGCNAATAENGPTDKARTTVETFLYACGHERALAAADLLTEETRTTFIEAGRTAEGCAKVLGIPDDEPDSVLRDAFKAARVTNAQTNGGFAAVTAEVPERGRPTVELSSVRGRWYLSNPIR